MSGIVVFGAGGRAGRASVAGARGRGHHVTAVVRDPARYGDLDHGGPRDVRYRTAHADAAGRASYTDADADADLAIAPFDEIDAPGHHRTHLGVEEG
ncbi:hypothetical protein [Streptosporangium sp. V21-05]|uniref:hypothetical protein n=1 Tax=Streptosporangium sp. V21-05 TaxID=3446115 RepID=UPI003F52A292